MSQLLESDLSSLRDWMVKGRFSIDRYTKKRERKTHKKRAIMEHNHDPMRIRLQHSKCLKFIEKVSFNIASEASYVYILSGQRLTKSARNGLFRRVPENTDQYRTGWF